MRKLQSHTAAALGYFRANTDGMYTWPRPYTISRLHRLCIDTAMCPLSSTQYPSLIFGHNYVVFLPACRSILPRFRASLGRTGHGTIRACPTGLFRSICTEFTHPAEHTVCTLAIHKDRQINPGKQMAMIDKDIPIADSRHPQWKQGHISSQASKERWAYAAICRIVPSSGAWASLCCGSEMVAVAAIRKSGARDRPLPGLPGW